eukprot:scaffold13706_cov121-Isochrysis_galbana.AAC.5
MPAQPASEFVSAPCEGRPHAHGLAGSCCASRSHCAPGVRSATAGPGWRPSRSDPPTGLPLWPQRSF